MSILSDEILQRVKAHTAFLLGLGHGLSTRIREARRSASPASSDCFYSDLRPGPGPRSRESSVNISFPLSNHFIKFGSCPTATRSRDSRSLIGSLSAPRTVWHGCCLVLTGNLPLDFPPVISMHAHGIPACLHFFAYATRRRT